MSKTRLMSLATTALAGLVLTGCGSASPGVAVKVGDQEVTVAEVDQVAANYCTAVGELDSEVPMGFVRQYVVQVLTLRAQADQIAEEYGVEAGSTYRNDVAQRQGTAATKPAAVRADYVDVSSAPAYAQDIVDQIGRIALERQGIDEPTADEVTQAGVDLFNQWPDAHGIEINPRYGLESVDGVLSPVDTNTSVAVSDQAKASTATEPDPSFALSLPPNHRCG